MAIPSVVQFSQQPGGGLVTALRGMNALNQDWMDSRIKAAKAQYAPWTEYANAASHIAYSNMLPYQTQATMLSNPMLWMALKDNPEALNAMIQNWKQSIPSPEQMRTGVNMPPFPQQSKSGNFLTNALTSLGNLLTGNNQQTSQNQMIMPQGQIQQSNNPLQYTGQPPVQQNQQIQQDIQQPVSVESPSILSPASQGNMQGVMGKQTAPFVSQPYEPGKVITYNGKNYSVPAGTTVADIQKAYVGVQNALPIMNRITEGAEEFLKPGSKKTQLLAKVNGLVKLWGGTDLIPEKVRKKEGIDDMYLGRYNDWLNQINTSIEPLISAFDLPKNRDTTHMLQEIMQPGTGESGKEYKFRVLNDIIRLKNERIPAYQAVLKNAIPLEIQGQAQKSQQNSEAIPVKPLAKTASDYLKNKIELPKFKTKEDFLTWFKRQPKVTQEAIRKQLGGG